MGNHRLLLSFLVLVSSSFMIPPGERAMEHFFIFRFQDVIMLVQQAQHPYALPIKELPSWQREGGKGTKRSWVYSETRAFSLAISIPQSGLGTADLIKLTSTENVGKNSLGQWFSNLDGYKDHLGACVSPTGQLNLIVVLVYPWSIYETVIISAVGSQPLSSPQEHPSLDVYI